MAVNYVKFFRGSSLAFESVPKNTDTLYFITDSDSNKSALYLGDKLIAGNITELADLNDFLLSELEDNQILAYDKDSEKWTNKAIIDIIDIMKGATEAEQGGMGLVPAPGIGQQEFFLRGDGTWATPTQSIELSTDNKTLETLEDGSTLSLKDFGKKYYKYIEASGSEETGDYVAAHYEVQIVDENNPWSEGLEPKVVNEDGKLILGWFEPNQNTLEGVIDGVAALQNKISELEKEVDTNASSIKDLDTDITGLSTELEFIGIEIEGKADADLVYTKEETDAKINEAVVSLDHLKRKTFDSLVEAEAFVETVSNPENYIYMVLNTSDALNNTYDEYIYTAEDGLRLVGNWEVNLEDYVTDVELATALMSKVDVEEGYSLISDEEKAKLADIEEGAQKNLFDQVNSENFSIDGIDGKRQLNLKSISISQVTNLEDILNNTATKEEVNTLNANFSNIDTRVTNLEKELNDLSNYITRAEYNEDMEIVMSAITWNDLDSTTTT